MKRKKFGEILYERRKITSEALANAIAEQHGKVVRLGELLLERDLVHRSDLLLALHEVTEAPQRIPRPAKLYDEGPYEAY
jgi:hypothetical protein